MMNKKQFDWVDFYKEFAGKLLKYKNNRKELVKKFLEIYKRPGLTLPSLLKGDITDIDPFTVFALFNNSSKSKNEDDRKKIISVIADLFGVATPEPTSFDGIPVTSNLAVRFYNTVGDQKDNDINELWSLFESALAYVDSNTPDNLSALSKYFDLCLNKHGNGTSKITMGLYWINPDFFLNLDSRNVWYIYQFEKEINKLEKETDESKKEIYKSKKEIYESKERLPSDLVNTLPAIKENEKISFSKYWDITDKLRNYLQKRKSDFKELSYEAWRCSEEINKINNINKEKGSKTQKKVKDKSNDLVNENVLAFPIDSVAESEKEQSSTYNMEKFLEEVYMDKESYKNLVALIKRKKNIILQGAPGVGKTFVAERLAYSMLGTKNDSHIMMVQFHQSYSYEDFIMGYRPTAGNGFELKHGAFYNFCKKAESDRQHEYFFIIDEINRGNLSKIFGELFMLIENDKRDVKLPLLYSEEKFAVPSNVYLIGTMNTADRSLAILDYALRRRFSFYEMSPSFEMKGFLDYKTELNNKKFDHLIKCVKELNEDIISDDSLGEGFYIGHSYFCNLNKNDVDNILAEIVSFELIPLLKEYWFDEPEKVNKWTIRLMDAIK